MNARKRLAELLEPGPVTSIQSRVLNLSLILLISLNVIAIFLETVDPIFLEYHQAFHYFEIFSVVIFTIEYFARV